MNQRSYCAVPTIVKATFMDTRQWLVLSTLYTAPGLTKTEIAHAVGFSRNSVASVISELRLLGLLRPAEYTDQSPTPPAKHYVTEAGSQLYRRG